MANLHTEDRDPLRTAREANATTNIRTTSARSSGAGWIIALVVLVALAIAAWIYSDAGTVAVDDTAPRVTTEPGTAVTTPGTTAPGATTPDAPAASAPATTAPADTAPAGTAPADTAPAGSAPADTAPAGDTTAPAAPPASAPANN